RISMVAAAAFTVTAFAADASMSDGEIKKVDKQTRKITIKHGPLVNLNMPPMTMVFTVVDAAMLDRVKPGEKVRFVAEQIQGAYVVSTLQPAQ
ncbi:MAG: copper-binding protein, partial [Noviherbaspirillum sp.]